MKNSLNYFFYWIGPLVCGRHRMCHSPHVVFQSASLSMAEREGVREREKRAAHWATMERIDWIFLPFLELWKEGGREADGWDARGEGWGCSPGAMGGSAIAGGGISPHPLSSSSLLAKLRAKRSGSSNRAGTDSEWIFHGRGRDKIDALTPKWWAQQINSRRYAPFILEKNCYWAIHSIQYAGF